MGIRTKTGNWDFDMESMISAFRFIQLLRLGRIENTWNKGIAHTVIRTRIVSRKASSLANAFSTSSSPEMLIKIVKAFCAIGYRPTTPQVLEIPSNGNIKV